MTTAGAAESPDSQAVRYVRSHKLNAPTPGDVRGALQTAMPLDWRHVWDEACAVAGVDPDVGLLDVRGMERLTAALAAHSAPAGLVGRSFAIRVAAFRDISAQAGPTNAPTWDWARESMNLLLRTRMPAPDRMAEIVRLDVFSQSSRQQLDRAAQKAAERLGTPVGLVSIVLDGAQQFAGSHGLTGWMEQSGGTPVEWSFCATMVRTAEPYLVPDTSSDVIQRYNPLVAHDGIGSYAGAPLITSKGEVLGSCCVISGEAREYSEQDVAVLRALADEIVAELERDRPRA
jgi:GAF domain-containing protein